MSGQELLARYGIVPTDYGSRTEMWDALEAAVRADPDADDELVRAVAGEARRAWAHQRDATVEWQEREGEAITAAERRERLRAYRARRATFEVGDAEPRQGQQLIVSTDDGWRYVRAVEVDPDADYTDPDTDPPMIHVAELARLGERDVERLSRAGELKRPKGTDVSAILGVTRLHALAVMEAVTTWRLDSDGLVVEDADGNPVPAGSIVDWYVYNPGLWEQVQGSTEQAREQRRRPRSASKAGKATRPAPDHGAMLSEAYARGARTTADFQQALGVGSRNTVRDRLEKSGWTEVGGGAGRTATWQPPAGPVSDDDLSDSDDAED